MTKVYQTKFGNKEGNCWNACIASILEIDINRIPYYNGSTRYEDYKKWFQGLDLDIITLTMFNNYYIPLVYYIISGKSPRGDLKHAVVGYNGGIVHDPHPDNTKLEEPEEDWIYTFIIPVKYNLDFGLKDDKTKNI